MGKRGLAFRLNGMINGGSILKDKQVIVAGGCGLIGREIVQQFKELRADVKSLDLSPLADLNFDLLETTFSWASGIDVFVNASYPETSEGHFRVFLDTSQFVADDMADHNGGSIVNIASIYGVIGGKPSIYEGTYVKPPPIGYSAAKGAIIAMTRALATKYGSFGVRVNCVSPGGIFDNQDPIFVERYNERVPLGRMATPKDVANAVIFLASDKANYITGQNLCVCGGLTIQ